MAAIGCCLATKKTRREASLAMSVEGIEPSTNGLKGHCSAIELHARTAKSILSRAVIGVNDFQGGSDIALTLTLSRWERGFDSLYLTFWGGVVRMGGKNSIFSAAWRLR
jgi:hypothetical protein